jgi:hypothetical protein
MIGRLQSVVQSLPLSAAGPSLPLSAAGPGCPDPFRPVRD